MINPDDDDHMSLADVNDIHFNQGSQEYSDPAASLLEEGSGELKRESFEKPNAKCMCDHFTSFSQYSCTSHATFVKELFACFDDLIIPHGVAMLIYLKGCGCSQIT
jgi:hypothetical protein